jgi:phospholipase/carboxylesterase
MIHDPNNYLTDGQPLDQANKVLILTHGRGSSARDMLALTQHLDASGFAFVAPQATGGTWYPYSFLAPIAQNEPNLSSALAVLHGLRGRLMDDFNVKPSQIYWLGFSQGACLTLEFAARHPMSYGGVFGLSGGLIGPDDALQNVDGSLTDVPVFLGCSDVDPHIPKNRVLDTAAILRQMGASVTTRLYPNFGHSINEDELDNVKQILRGNAAAA